MRNSLRLQIVGLLLLGVFATACPNADDKKDGDEKSSKASKKKKGDDDVEEDEKSSKKKKKDDDEEEKTEGAVGPTLQVCKDALALYDTCGENPKADAATKKGFAESRKQLAEQIANPNISKAVATDVCTKVKEALSKVPLCAESAGDKGDKGASADPPKPAAPTPAKPAATATATAPDPSKKEGGKSFVQCGDMSEIPPGTCHHKCFEGNCPPGKKPTASKWGCYCS